MFFHLFFITANFMLSLYFVLVRYRYYYPSLFFLLPLLFSLISWVSVNCSVILTLSRLKKIIFSSITHILHLWGVIWILKAENQWTILSLLGFVVELSSIFVLHFFLDKHSLGPFFSSSGKFLYLNFIFSLY